jgi:signal transduction histidine kinase
VITALLENAGRYTPDDTPIEVEVLRCDDDVCVKVVDHGPGIPSDQRDAIFERFHRLEDPLTMRTGGVGIGLFLSRRLTEAMHGRLELEPTAMGGGATFTVFLPVGTPSDVGAATRRDTPLPTPEWPTR